MYRLLIPALAVSLLTGFFIGGTVSVLLFRPAPVLVVIDDQTAASVPVLHIDGIRNGALVGSVQGDVRLVAGDDIIPTGASGSFAITDRSVLTNVIHITVPVGMHFVASKKGKKYYPVGSAAANNLSPANRIYFPDAQAAERAGFRK